MRLSSWLKKYTTLIGSKSGHCKKGYIQDNLSDIIWYFTENICKSAALNGTLNNIHV
jgi:hypothetical protein